MWVPLTLLTLRKVRSSNSASVAMETPLLDQGSATLHTVTCFSFSHLRLSIEMQMHLLHLYTINTNKNKHAEDALHRIDILREANECFGRADSSLPECFEHGMQHLLLFSIRGSPSLGTSLM